MKCLETETVEMQNFRGDKRQNGKDLRSIGTYLTFADNLLYQEQTEEELTHININFVENSGKNI